MTHTPGPWAITKGAYGALHVGPASLAHPGKDATHYALERGRDLLAQRAADAALIAAAPDLLAALKALHAAHRAFSGSEDWGVYDDDARAAAEVAIAKAEAGKEP